MKITALIILLTLSMFAHADRSKFCAGFTEGYKTIQGNRARVARCPIEPRTPRDSTDYREGIKAGIAAGKRDAKQFGQFDNGPGRSYVTRRSQ